MDDMMDPSHWVRTLWLQPHPGHPAFDVVPPAIPPSSDSPSAPHIYPPSKLAYGAFPHILEAVLKHSEDSTLRALRATCRDLKSASEKHLSTHMTMGRAILCPDRLPVRHCSFEMDKSGPPSSFNLGTVRVLDARFESLEDYVECVIARGQLGLPNLKLLRWLPGASDRWTVSTSSVPSVYFLNLTKNSWYIHAQGYESSAIFVNLRYCGDLPDRLVIHVGASREQTVYIFMTVAEMQGGPNLPLAAAWERLLRDIASISHDRGRRVVMVGDGSERERELARKAYSPREWWQTLHQIPSPTDTPSITAMSFAELKEKVGEHTVRLIMEP